MGGGDALASLLCMMKISDTARSPDKPVSVQEPVLNLCRAHAPVHRLTPTALFSPVPASKKGEQLILMTEWAARK